MNEEKIKRYEYLHKKDMGDGYLRTGLSESDNGVWCRAEDVTALESELPRLREENEKMKEERGFVDVAINDTAWKLFDDSILTFHNANIVKEYFYNFLSSLKGETS